MSHSENQTEAFDIAIVGGGIVGLATAYALSEEFPQLRLALFEKEKSVGGHQTGHNSGVIHSGIYYKPQSYKARLCVQGRTRLIEFCQAEGVTHEICGKIIVATHANQIPQLKLLQERGIANGLQGIRYLSPQEIQEKEPSIRGVAGLWVPQTGIVDYVQMAQKLRDKIASRGVALHLGVSVDRAESLANADLQLHTSAGLFRSRFLIGCAGLQSDRLARKSRTPVRAQIVPFRGEYYKFKPEHRGLIRNLIYPVPDPKFPFLGVHFTRMFDGEVECGPNAVLAYSRENYGTYAFNLKDAWDTFTYPGFWRFAARHWRTGLREVRRSFSKRAFVSSLRELMPEIQSEQIEFAGSGIRAQAMRDDGGMIDDFEIFSTPRQLHILNAPSPAATASLAIGEEIRLLARKEFKL